MRGKQWVTRGTGSMTEPSYEDVRREAPLRQMLAALPGAQRQRSARRQGPSGAAAVPRLPPAHLAAWQGAHAAWLSQQPLAAHSTSHAPLCVPTTSHNTAAAVSGIDGNGKGAAASVNGASGSITAACVSKVALNGVDSSSAGPSVAAPSVSPAAADASLPLPVIGAEANGVVGQALQQECPPLTDHPPHHLLPDYGASNGRAHPADVPVGSAQVAGQLAANDYVMEETSEASSDRQSDEIPVEESQPSRWGIFEDATNLEGLKATLDSRGEREALLNANLEVKPPSLPKRVLYRPLLDQGASQQPFCSAHHEWSCLALEVEYSISDKIDGTTVLPSFDAAECLSRLL